MYLQRPDETSGGSRFLLALTLSTVTAFAVAAPLAFKAMTVDSDLGGQDADVSEIEESTTTTVPPSGPQIGPKVRSPLAKLPIRPGLPSDYPDESTVQTQTATSAASTPTTAAATIASTTTTTTSNVSSVTETTNTSISTSTSSTSSTSSTVPSTTTTVDVDSAPSGP